MEKIIKYQKQIFLGFVFLIIVSFTGSIYLNKVHVFTKFDYKTWEDKYNKSQWIVPQSKNEISDDDLYLFVGAKLINGHDPSLLSAEVPPLGKYLIGLFTLVTGRIGFYGIFFSALSLILLFSLNRILFKSNLLAIIPVAIFSFEMLFKEQIGVSLLDAQYLCLLLVTFIFLLKDKHLLAGISAGLFMATKSPFVVIVLYATIFSYLLIKRKINLFNLILMPVLSVAAYSLVYLKYFFLGHSFIDFLKVQKYMLHFYQTGAKGALGAVMPMIFTGYWFTWFDRNQFIKDWNILWPIIFVLSVIFTLKFVKKWNGADGFTLISIWVFLYTAFLVFTPIYPRYLLLSLPFMYNLAIWGLLKLTKPQLLQQLS